MFGIDSRSWKKALVILLTMLALAAMTVPALALGKAVVLKTPMTGAEEAPGPGDPDGFGRATFRINLETSEICWVLKAFDIAPATAAHIHLAPPGSPGPVVVPLSPPTDGVSMGCATADSALLMDIVENPGDYYVNVHNADFPPGAIRGQLGD
jgi:hypothetical protein